MRIQCDVCEKGEALVYCVADEAALCSSCDHRVHHANKLASKHQRFSLIHPPDKQAPLCDICQERRAFLFCQQDRAIFCRECDVRIHKANEHTEKHSRFLLTGVKLSATSALYSSSSSSPSQAEAAISTTTLTNVSDAVPSFNSHNRVNKPRVSVNPTVPKTIAKATPSAFVDTVTAAALPSIPDDEDCINNNVQMMNGGDNANSSPPTSSIAEYLIEFLPGWHVEDFLDSSSPHGFCKSTTDSDAIPFWDGGLDGNLSCPSSESTGLWVPQAERATVNPPQNQWFSNTNISFGGQIGSKDILTVKSNRKWNYDNIFAVPQINPHSPASKRLKTLR